MGAIELYFWVAAVMLGIAYVLFGVAEVVVRLSVVTLIIDIIYYMTHRKNHGQS